MVEVSATLTGFSNISYTRFKTREEAEEYSPYSWQVMRLIRWYQKKQNRDELVCTSS
jgi:hypothetical protein